MALLSNKTYSKFNVEATIKGDREKENIDPFDELLSSPLKQDVQFQPLSFWGQKVKELESKKKTKLISCGLYETSDSDDIASRNKKKKTKNAVEMRTVGPKVSNKNLQSNKSVYSAACSFIEKAKTSKIFLRRGEEAFAPSKDLKDFKDQFLNNNNNINIKNKNNNNNNNNNNNINNNENNSLNSLGEATEKLKSNCVCCRRFCKKSVKTNCNCKKYSERVFNKDSNSFGREIFYDNDSSGSDNKKVRDLFSNNFEFKIHKDLISPTKQVENSPDIIEDSITKNTFYFNDKEETFYKNQDNYKFVTTKRFYNYPNISLEDQQTFWSENLLEENSFDKFTSETKEYLKIFSKNSQISSDISVSSSNTVSSNSTEDSFMEKSNTEYYSLNTKMDHQTVLSSEFDLMDFKVSQVQDKTKTQINLQHGSFTTPDSSSASDDTVLEINNDTIIKAAHETNENRVEDPDSSSLENYAMCVSPSKKISDISTAMSDLTISNITGEEFFLESKTKVLQVLKKESSNEDIENKSSKFDVRNVTTKRRIFLGDNCSFSKCDTDKPKLEIEPEQVLKCDCNISHILTDGMDSEWNKTMSFVNPIFESTRVSDINKVPQSTYETSPLNVESTLLNHTYALKPGKKWMRSMSILKQLQNSHSSGNIYESTRKTGRNFESFVQEMLEMQNEKSRFFSCSKNATFSNDIYDGQSTMSNYLTGCEILPKFKDLQKDVTDNNEHFSLSNSFLSETVSNKTIFESSMLSHTVKLVQAEDKSSAFRSALGLEASTQDSLKDKSFSISAKDFILMQCGQQDILLFEEYFNERTLKNCRKIGEGVYGEVFLSSDSVIKIIPIEGSEKVNGEPQKTFEEIISEIVIAMKLSSLRKGEDYRTDGFSELKRCWCVKGKYPKYLLKLWDEYDQSGTGSENDSPIMFKNDQLYIILELANGGKDLESYIFTSSAQSLSIFIQAAFSLAIAEKAFEFEHRDLHWGNILISETKQKMTTMILDGVEHVIPTKGVKVCIIDFTLSRISHEGCCIFNDLSVDPSMFVSEGDYQFEIYRLMLRELKNDWSLFKPRNNIFWLHYTVDKMIKMVRYKNKKSKIHINHLKVLKTLESTVLQYKSTTDFVMSDLMQNLINKL